MHWPRGVEATADFEAAAAYASGGDGPQYIEASAQSAVEGPYEARLIETPDTLQPA